MGVEPAGQRREIREKLAENMPVGTVWVLLPRTIHGWVVCTGPCQTVLGTLLLMQASIASKSQHIMDIYSAVHYTIRLKTNAIWQCKANPIGKQESSKQQP